jgi:hypothetical protein
LQLEYVVPLFLVGEVVRKLTSRATTFAVLASITTVVVATAAPLHLGPLIAIVVGVSVGFATTGKEVAE